MSLTSINRPALCSRVVHYYSIIFWKVRKVSPTFSISPLLLSSSFVDVSSEILTVLK